MRLDNEKPDYDSIEDRRGQGGGFGFPGGRRGGGVNIPIGTGRGGLSIKTIIVLVIIYFIFRFLFGLDLLQVLNGGMPVPGSQDTQITLPDTRTEVTDNSGGGLRNPNVPSANSDAGKEFVARVLGSNNRVWGEILGGNYQKPKLVLFDSFVQSACGNAQAAMGPFYCPADQKVYIDLSFYQDMKNKLGAPGDFAQAYVIAHEVGHHVQNLLGIADDVQQARMRASRTDANALSVKMELQADCFAGIWAQEANASANILEDGDIEEGLNAAAAIGDDRLQKQSQGYVVPESFTHGSSAQRVNWFRKGLSAQSLKDCDTFSAGSL
ncbi:neutral zinc metallopeptidase [Aestuariivirga sp.]|uniref:KPN_02809 family neutral zinc metallopeptidase n=1 Tax=Aestuariivirga sp. TaxID=2650926 RepID=UPI0025B8A34C|nr:neutral zinc metallopeptidase [Aestuariivirga sp.]MCA3556057.1 zinc metallopeptidase [Aestuariivirga sp.]